MHSSIKFTLVGLVLMVGIGLSGALFGVYGMWQTPTSNAWLIAGGDANQITVRDSITKTYLGSALTVGDINADGYDDLIVGSRISSERSKSVYVFAGPLSAGATYTVPDGVALTIQDESAAAYYGHLDSGDMNGDGSDDIVFSNVHSHSAWVYLGSPEISTSSPATVTNRPGNMALTLTPVDGVVLFCDINGDGYQDIFANRFSFDTGVQVFGVLGSASITNAYPMTLTMPTFADILIQGFVLPPPVSWFQPNTRNMECDDIDGDGFADLAIGIHEDSPPNRHKAGVVYIMRGSPEFNQTLRIVTMPDAADAIIDGVDGRIGQAGDELGKTIASADVNRDGLADLILGAPTAYGRNNSIPYAGEVYLWLGRALEGQRFTIADQASWTVQGSNGYDYLGEAITSGDFDNDGIAEILLGCEYCERWMPPDYHGGRAYLLDPLRLNGTVSVTDSARLKIMPMPAVNCLGYVAESMDADGDGVTDMVISAPCTDPPEANLHAGVYIIPYPSQFKQRLPIVTKP